MNITWQLVRGKELSSAIIGYFGAGYYSHIDVITPNGLLRGARSDWIGAVPPGVHDRSQHYESWVRCTRYTVEVSPDQYARYWAFSDKQLGKPYDTRGLFRTFVLGQPRDWRAEDSWWCSELVAANGEHAGIWKIPPEVRYVTPGDCAFLFAGKQAIIQEV